LPDLVVNGEHSSDENDESPKKFQKKILFNQIDDIAVAEIYENMINPK
jgi:hypothetical protein